MQSICEGRRVPVACDNRIDGRTDAVGVRMPENGSWSVRGACA